MCCLYLAITVRFSAASYNFNEGTQMAQPVITFSNPSSFDIIVTVVTDDITANGVNTSNCSDIDSEKDYMSGVYNYNIRASEIRQVVDIPICDDIVLERDELFSLAIISNSHPDNVTNGSPDNVMITIVDNDRKLFGKIVTYSII